MSLAFAAAIRTFGNQVAPGSGALNYRLGIPPIAKYDA
ncbi:hypothetical protein LMIY3S_01293 [Labrys miyagiensis]